MEHSVSHVRAQLAGAKDGKEIGDCGLRGCPMPVLWLHKQSRCMDRVGGIQILSEQMLREVAAEVVCE